MYVVDYSIKEMFFDGLEVQKRLDKAAIKELSKIGAFIRRRARSLLRRRKRPSEPGEPPSVHSSDKTASLKNILFGLDRRSQSVVVGPVGLRKKDGQTIPGLLEFGGSLSLLQEQHKRPKNDEQLWYDYHAPQRPWKRYRTKHATYERRPFMEPALAAEVEAGTIRDVWVASLEQ
jgi:hypothetical protein